VKIGEVAKLLNISVSALRFYDKQNLMPVKLRRESGYREYTTDDISRLRLIIAAKRLRFSLSTIRLLLDAVDEKPEPCEEIAKFVEQKVQEIKKEITTLESVKTHLTSQLLAWRNGLLSCQDCMCAIIESEPALKNKEYEMNQSKIEIFVAGCGLCDEAVRVVKEAVAPCGCDVVVLKADSEDASSRGIKQVPCIWKDGERVFCGVPSQDEAIRLLRKE
jgi:DNA-binding transcriptional MerR regulator